MPADPTNRILTARAREVLRPLGFTQRGRSRTWQEDHGWWILYVNFQPSGFGKGTYLNVYLHWLWRLGADRLTGLSMDYGNRVTGAGASFKDEEQWASAVDTVVSRAVDEVHRLRRLVPDLPAAANVCVEQEESRIADVAERYEDMRPDDVVSGWPTWHAAVASGLVGDLQTAGHYFERITRLADDREFFAPYRERAHEWLDLVRQDHALFAAQVREDVNLQRATLKLPALTTPEGGRAYG